MILAVLEESEDPMAAKEIIAKVDGVSEGSIRQQLSKMTANGELEKNFRREYRLVVQPRKVAGPPRVILRRKKDKPQETTE